MTRKFPKGPFLSEQINKNKRFSERSGLYGKILVGSNPAFWCYLRPPISHIERFVVLQLFLYILYIEFREVGGRGGSL